MSTNFYTILRGGTKSLAIVSKNTRLVALQPVGERAPFFMASSYPYFIDVVKLIGTERPVLSLIVPEEPCKFQAPHNAAPRHTREREKLPYWQPKVRGHTAAKHPKRVIII